MSSHPAPGEGAAAGDDDRKDLAKRRAVEATEDAASAKKTAERRRNENYLVGIVGAVAGALATAAIIADRYPGAAGILAAVAGALAAAGTLLNLGARADLHWRRNAALHKLAEDYDTLASMAHEPTRPELEELTTRRQAIMDLRTH
jgi:hypothetical protein